MNSTVNTTLENVCDFIGGSQPAKKYFSEIKLEGYIRLIQIRDYKTDVYVTYIPENSTRKFCNETDVMIGRYGPPIFQILRGISGAYNVALMKAIPKENILNNYLYYFLSQEHLFEYVNALSPRTGGQTGVDVVMLKKYPIQLPNLSTQKKIAKVLSDLDTKIELNNKINSELEAMAKLIYDYWFVQFDFPDENGKPYKTSSGKMIYNEKLKRKIPDGWGFDIVGNILAKEQFGGKTPSSEYLYSGSIPIIDQSTKFICGYTNDEKKRIKTIAPRIVFGDHTRILKLINFDFARGADGTQVLLSKEERVPQHFFYHSLLKIDLSNYGYARHFKFLKDTKTIIPAIDIVDKFEEKAKIWYDMIWANKKQNQKLAELRDWLLPMLMNGQVRVN
jgi:type I restriction enzyme S subunit